jgi:hypothetical protein
VTSACGHSAAGPRVFTCPPVEDNTIKGFELAAFELALPSS